MSGDGEELRDLRVGLLYDSVSANTGDIAIGIAGIQELARHGVEGTVVLDPFGPHLDSVDAVVVGGGELIRPVGDPFYDTFRLEGGTFLNAAGVRLAADHLEYLRDYEVVSARSTVEAEVLSRFVDDVRVVPCTTTTLESDPYDIPGLGDDEPVVGIHVVPHTLELVPQLVELIDAIPYRKVFIPFTHYNYDDSFMSAVPFDRRDAIWLPRLSPLELHAAIRRMTYVVTSSLHASLFAYSQNVPFVSVHQEKVASYFGDRGLERFVFRSAAQFREAVEEVQSGEVDFSELVRRDREGVHDVYAAYAAALGRRGRRRTVDAPPTEGTSALDAQRVVSTQREGVVLQRDAVLHQLYLRVLGAERNEHIWHAEADRLAARVAELEARVTALEPAGRGRVR